MATPTQTPPHSDEDTSPQAPGALRWHEALHDPQLQDLPYKIETNRLGQLVLSPHKTRHSDLQGDITLLLYERGPSEKGRPRPEYPVYTSDGVKVPDVIWISDARANEIPDDAEASPVMPEICAEVLSSSNTEDEMDEKRRLFFEAGAEEVWLIDTDGNVRFFGPDGERDQSALAPAFPKTVNS